MVDVGIYRNNMLWRSLVQRLLLTQAVFKLPLSSEVRIATVGQRIMRHTSLKKVPLLSERVQEMGSLVQSNLSRSYIHRSP